MVDRATDTRGWEQSDVDPMAVVALFPGLRVRSGFVLRASRSVELGNGFGIVWAGEGGRRFGKRATNGVVGDPTGFEHAHREVDHGTVAVSKKPVTSTPAILCHTPFMSGYMCASCGVPHEDMPLCFLSPMPVVAALIAEAEHAERVALSSDQCIVDGEHFFILGNLDVPIHDHEEVVRWTVWSTLSKKNFLRAADLWDTEGREHEPPYFGWLSSTIPGYPETLHLKLDVLTQEVGVRPLLIVHEQDHPLSRDQREGITWERACELSRAATGD